MPGTLASSSQHFDGIVTAHTPLLRRVAALRGGVDQADDIVAETLIDAWRQYRIDPTVVTRPWLVGVTINKSKMLDRSSRRWRARLRKSASHVDHHVDETEDVVDRIDAATAAPQLLRAFAALPETPRVILALVAWAGLTPHETAEALGLKPSTVRSHLRRARNHLERSIPHTMTRGEPS